MQNKSARRILRFVLAALTAAVLMVAAALPAAALTVTFVRHGESGGNASGKIDTKVPGPSITALGQTQAEAVAAALAATGVDYDAIYASNMVRTSETAQPFADATGLGVTVLPGVRELSAGIFEGSPENSGLGRYAYGLVPMAWILGNRFLPVLGSEDGNSFDARVDGALKQIEDSGAQNAVVFSHGVTMMYWTMMNVDNPDLGLLLTHRLGNTDMVVVEGSAEEGWTLKSWAGKEVGPASLGTKMFVNVRDLVVTPQTAVYNVVQALSTRDIGKIANAIRDGVVDTVTAPVKFVGSVVRDIGNEIRGAHLQAPINANTAQAEKISTTETSKPDLKLVASDTPAVKAEVPAVKISNSAPALKVSDSSDTKIDVPAVEVSVDKVTTGATDLTDGNKVTPGMKHATPRPVRQLQKAADDLGKQVQTSLTKLHDAVKKATGQKTGKPAETVGATTAPDSTPTGSTATSVKDAA